MTREGRVDKYEVTVNDKLYSVRYENRRFAREVKTVLHLEIDVIKDGTIIDRFSFIAGDTEIYMTRIEAHNYMKVQLDVNDSDKECTDAQRFFRQAVEMTKNEMKAISQITGQNILDQSHLFYGGRLHGIN